MALGITSSVGYSFNIPRRSRELILMASRLKKNPLKLVCKGCFLSLLLYVKNNEILALQFLADPYLAGFDIQGEKIISTPYKDNAVIKITQNKCFKEVYKDKNIPEKTTGAKVNYNETVRLGLGKWKSRTDDSFHEVGSDDKNQMDWQKLWESMLEMNDQI